MLVLSKKSFVLPFLDKKFLILKNSRVLGYYVSCLKMSDLKLSLVYK